VSAREEYLAEHQRRRVPQRKKIIPTLETLPMMDAMMTLGSRSKIFIPVSFQDSRREPPYISLQSNNR
jgi:hypothetical protein